MICTQVLTNKSGQVVRIPKEFRIDNSEVVIKKIGSTIILYPKTKPWENLQKSLSDFTDDFMTEGRNQPKLDEREEF